MRRLLILTSKAASLSNVAADIADVASEQRYIVRPVRHLMTVTEITKISDGCIIVYPFNPSLCAPHMLLARDLHRRGFPVVYYGPVEGRPNPYSLQSWMLGSFPAVACSEYVREKLTEAGFMVTDVVYHGINLRLVEQAKAYVGMVRSKIRNVLKAKVVFGTMAWYHVRKGLEKFAQAIRIVTQQVRDVGFYVITNDRGAKLFRGLPNTYVETSFGARSRTEVLAWYGAIDFYVLPSLAEGFGLPLIEANAFGTLVIHSWYPPLSEISDEAVNITFPFDLVREVNLNDGIIYELHDYDVKRLADAILKAYDLAVNNPDELKARKVKAMEHARKFDIHKLYPRLLELVFGEGK